MANQNSYRWHRSGKPTRNIRTRPSLATIDGTPVRHHVHVARSAGAMLHPILQLRFRASALGAEVLVLAARVLLTKRAGTPGEHGEAQHAMVHLVCDRQQPWIVH